MKIAHVADLHFGRRMTTVSTKGENIRETDIYRAGDLVANYIAMTLHPDVVVLAGDVWDTASPGSAALRNGFDFAQTIRSADIPTIVIGGNHDTLTSINKATPLEHLERYFDCRVLTEQTSFEINDVLFHAIPYRTLSTGSLKQPDWSNNQSNILIGHATADGADLPDFAKYDRTRLPQNITLNDNLTLGILGHIHIHSEVAKNVFYSGAIERLQWGEITNEPAIYLHTIEDDKLVSSETIYVKDMGNGEIPRPAYDLYFDLENLDAKQSIDKIVSEMKNQWVEDALFQITLNSAPREIHAISFEDQINKEAKNAAAFAVKIRTNLRTGQELAFNHAGPTPGATLADTYLEWAKPKYGDIAQIGANMISGS